MAFKVVVRFNGTTIKSSTIPGQAGPGRQHSYGFSESYITSTSSIDTEKEFLRAKYAPRRAALLPSQTEIIGATFYQIGGGRGIPVALSFPGTSGATDVVNDAVLCTSNNSNAAVARKWWVHNVPDSQFTGGEFDPSFTYAARFNAYLDEIGFASWLGIVRANNIAVVTIDANGLVTCGSAHAFAVGQFVTISRTLDANGKKKGGLFRVSTLGPLSSQFTLLNWTFGACTGGSAFLKQNQSYVIGASGRPIIERAGTRRVGRPFNVYRGRSSRQTGS